MRGEAEKCAISAEQSGQVASTNIAPPAPAQVQMQQGQNSGLLAPLVDESISTQILVDASSVSAVLGGGSGQSVLPTNYQQVPIQQQAASVSFDGSYATKPELSELSGLCRAANNQTNDTHIGCARSRLIAIPPYIQRLVTTGSTIVASVHPAPN